MKLLAQDHTAAWWVETQVLPVPETCHLQSPLLLPPSKFREAWGLQVPAQTSCLRVPAQTLGQTAGQRDLEGGAPKDTDAQEHVAVCVLLCHLGQCLGPAGTWGQGWRPGSQWTRVPHGCLLADGAFRNGPSAPRERDRVGLPQQPGTWCSSASLSAVNSGSRGDKATSQSLSDWKGPCMGSPRQCASASCWGSLGCAGSCLTPTPKASGYLELGRRPVASEELRKFKIFLGILEQRCFSKEAVLVLGSPGQKLGTVRRSSLKKGQSSERARNGPLLLLLNCWIKPFLKDFSITCANKSLYCLRLSELAFLFLVTQIILMGSAHTFLHLV
ncbi:uncharacterized protein LOC107142151 isoform X2 [Marmota marmota marmota]|uniref:uncharacterized protein LOC107142151 isoform X2 n=1 Tax=Marmota marmota marmota TaxID=9994 RepID=UPI002092A58B|nr:uncharacterized protein LOC107142151 isoform X2 [Marmota marmota marmota]